MAEMNFRTAMGGFHRGDVTAYISQTAAAHQKKLKELQEELDALRAEKETLRQENDALRQESETLRQENETLRSHPDAPGAETPEPDPETPLREQELEAYRRAEAAERLANQRAGKIYEQLRSLCEESAVRTDAAERAALTALENLERQLEALRSAAGQLHGNMRETTDALRAIERTAGPEQED